MADTVGNVIDMNGTHVLDNGTIITTQDMDGTVVTEVTDEDIIQQALDEATGTFVQAGVEYTTGTDPEARVEEDLIASVVPSEAFVTEEEMNGERGQLVTDDGSNTAFDGTTNDSINDQLVVTAFSENVAESGENYSNSEYAVVKPDSDFSQEMETDNMTNNSTVVPSSVQNNVLKLDTSSGRISVTLMPSNQASGAPLGSSQNPIRIIQQGNQYTPMQNLSAEQLQQIMQVVQQQQVAKSSTAEGSSILFNPQTNTRIVYRVIYPSELHKNSPSSIIKTVGGKKQSQGQQTQTLVFSKDGLRRQYKKRMKEDEEDDEDRFEAPDLSREEKEERKKHRPRTRSGRISKPPKHMVKDYKHLHVLDFEEEEAADHSDGGYSDYKYSDDEEDENDHVIEEQEEFTFSLGFGSTGKPKKFQCSVCNKAYVGQGSLERHYRSHPDHAPEGMQFTTPVSSMSHNGFNSTGNMSEDSNTQDSTSSTPPRIPTSRGYYPRRGGSRGRPPGPNAALRRRSRLQDMISSCSDEDLIGLVLPRIAKVFTLWDFLLLKVQKGVPRRPHADDIYKEFQTLAKEVKEVCSTFMQPATEKSTNTLKIEDEKLAGAVGLEAGVYEIKEMPATQESITFPPRAAIAVNSVNSAVKRNLNTVIKDEISSPAKKFKPTMTGLIPASPSSSSLSSQNSSNSSIVVHPSSVTTANKKMTLSNNDPALNNLGRSSNQTPIVIHPISSSTMSKAVAKVKTQGTAALSSTLNSQKLIISQSQPSAPILVQSASARSRVQPTIASGAPVVVQNVPHQVISGGVSLLNKVNKTTPSISSSGETKIVRIVSPEGLITCETPINSTPTATVSQVGNGARNTVTVTPSVVVQDNTGIVRNLTVTHTEAETLQIPNSIMISLPTTRADIQTTSADIQIANNDEESFVTTDFIGSTPGASENLMTAEAVSVDGTAQVVGEVEQTMEDDSQAQEGLIQYVDESTLEGSGLQTNQIITASNIYQTPDGFIIIQNEDGSTVQLQGGDGEPIPLETVQALLAMDADGQTILQTTESELVQ